ncbi:enoyl-CoA hydratase [Mycolicibacterium fortuitum]|uniref:Probable enoyl-CoA hydratase EchA17 n=1 Tax=Mycolicibacterium fortuitum TaxID=1766 RepID=A0ABD6QC69_MYCFO|nr:crotonase/enoyl-CoA hydratase family protein [Mycolicibacterium fortuitum]OMC33121.1 enoyl-CoA hydratase [Mycolicibacterium fortuitum]
MSAPVDLTVADGIATIRLDRPAVRNAVDAKTARLIAAALDQVDDRTDIRVAVLTGSDTVFCAGMDLKAFSATGDRPISETRGGFGIVRKPPVKPIIAAVEGSALGGGLEIAMACDLIVAGESARFGLPEVKRGLVAAAGGVLRLPRRIPSAVAMELILTGDAISAAEAKSLGLVNRVVADGRALAAAVDLAGRIAANGPLAVAGAKRLVYDSAAHDIDTAFDLQSEVTGVVRASNDAKEGAAAFVEKRAPQWTGT